MENIAKSVETLNIEEKLRAAEIMPTIEVCQAYDLGYKAGLALASAKHQKS